MKGLVSGGGYLLGSYQTRDEAIEMARYWHEHGKGYTWIKQAGRHRFSVYGEKA